ncbi:MAG: hypothetical protein QNJ54_06765 [Prochloraceae cyanobacterium]|nr:hypothetical protein [Prochloraceae cyanobacterium]
MTSKFLKKQGDWKIGDSCLERGIHHVTIVRFAWCKNVNSVLPIVRENGIERFAHFRASLFQ